MKKNKLCLVLGLLTMSLLAGCGSDSKDANSQENEKLVVAMELAYPPFETKDNNGDPMGVSVDIAKAFGEYIGKEVEITNTSWEGLIPALQTDKADMVISSMTITDERAEVVEFSNPYAMSILAILSNIDSDVESIEDLNDSNKTVVVKTGSTGFFYAEKYLPNANIIALADESACITEVSQGKADGFLYDQLTIYRNWQNNLDTTKAIFIPFQDAEVWGVAFKKDENELVEQMNDFIKAYRAEGGFVAITEKYLSEEKEAFDELGFEWFF